MVNFNLEGLDELKTLTEGSFGNFLTTLGVLAVFFIILASIAIVFLWVFGSIGLMNIAKKNNISTGWLAFIPVGRSYLIGKLGFDVYDSNNKNKTTFMWITFGLGAAAFILGNSNSDLNTLVKYSLLFFESWAFYNMFKNLNSQKAIVYTVFTVLTGTLLGGLFLYLMKTEENKTNDIKEAFVVEKKKEEKKEPPKGEFCSNCGTKLTKTAKFCPECGKEKK